MLDEGYIKFDLQWDPAPPLAEAQIADLNTYRSRLFDLGLIGYYEKEGVGFGNISQRCEGEALFIVSGTQTGHLSQLGPEHYAEVLDFDLDRNFLHCRGPIKASSESMTHAVFYQLDPSIQAVLHVHHLHMWQSLLHRLPTTAEDVPYGTPEMAREIERLYRSGSLDKDPIVLMAGHREGIFTFGKDLSEAFERLMKAFAPFAP